MSELLRKHYSHKKAIEIATILSEGRWAHDFPILVVNAKQLGLPSVLYVPFRRAGGLESLTLLPGLFP